MSWMRKWTQGQTITQNEDKGEGKKKKAAWKGKCKLNWSRRISKGEHKKIGNILFSALEQRNADPVTQRR